MPEADGLHRITLADGRHAIIKRQRHAPADFFAAEARGLAALARIGALRVPVVHDVGDDFITIEDLGHGSRAPDYWQRAGAGLAAQHTATSEHFGWNRDGFCGDSPQDNTRDGDGWRFFAERRLQPQMRRARDHGLIEPRDVARIEHLCTHLREHVPDMPPVLLHGDLWSGNLHVCADGAPALIDAGAVHDGWAEADLAMLVLFGAPPEAFFHAYAEHATLRKNWRDRSGLYNTYHLLNHVNLFGAGYLPALRQTLAHFA
ncbi:MAG TPA: fructosamine kinase family protein [Oleiagrimonas sp.]|nr:fructosamine kinase family protein [Oleiagrimonas sp.]